MTRGCSDSDLAAPRSATGQECSWTPGALTRSSVFPLGGVSCIVLGEAKLWCRAVPEGALPPKITPALLRCRLGSATIGLTARNVPGYPERWRAPPFFPFATEAEGALPPKITLGLFRFVPIANCGGAEFGLRRGAECWRGFSGFSFGGGPVGARWGAWLGRGGLDLGAVAPWGLKGGGEGVDVGGCGDEARGSARGGRAGGRGYRFSRGRS